LGFTVVVAWEQLSSAEANVSNESSTLATMYRQMITLPAPQQTTMRTLLRKYTAAVQAKWDRQGSDAASATARAAITDMYRVRCKQKPPAASDSIDAESVASSTS
jgi:hypothetical protein